jgi:CheY-like chemotaxis protein
LTDDHRVAGSISRILLVEDHEVSREMLTRRLQRRGYSVCCAIDGPTAVAMATSELPDVILMDVALGGMDGWEATQRIKGNPVTDAIPIIALTARALESDREKSVEVGCSDFDTKPVDIERLLGKIRALTEVSGSVSETTADDRRRAARQRIFKAATIGFAGGGISCTVRNISETGANLEVAAPFGIPRLCTLVIDGENTTRDCTVAWCTEKRIGVKFTKPAAALLAPF